MSTNMPTPGDPRRFGIDQSQYQGLTHYNVFAIAQPEAEYCAVRTGISWGYQDKFFPHHWGGLKDIGVKRAPYHVLFPNEDINRQVDNMLRVTADDPGEGPPIADVELIHGASRQRLTDAAEAFCERLKLKYGRAPIMYTRPYFVRDEMVPDASWYNDYYWWMAVYTLSGLESTETHFLWNMNHSGIAVDVANVLFVQTSENGRGAHWGAKSIELDYDRFRGSQIQWNEVWNEVSVPPIPGPDPANVTVTYPQDDVVVTLDPQ